MLLKLARRLVCAHHRRSVTAAPQRGVAVLVNCIFRSRRSGWPCMAITNRASALPNEQCMPKSQKHTFQGFYTIACYKNMAVIETAFDIARVGILTSSRWGGGANDCTSTEGIHGKTAASPSEWSLAAYRGVAVPHKLPFHPADHC